MNQLKKGIFTIFVVTILCQTSCTKKISSTDNTFRYYVRENIRTLDPIHAHDLFSHQMAAQLYEGLYHFHYLKRPIEIEPLIAQSLPHISKDGRTYTIPLKKNIYFHDSPCFPNTKGRELVADDFIYSIKRLADPKNKSESFWVVENKIVGLDSWREFRKTNRADYKTPVAGLKAIDSHTLQIELVVPNFQFVQNLAMAATLIVPHEAVDYFQNDFGNLAVGTGAFQLKNWIRGSQLQLVKNPNYQTLNYPLVGEATDTEKGYLKNAGQKLPLIDKIIIYEVTEPQPQWLMFAKGELDALMPHKDYSGEFIENGQLNKKSEKKGFTLDLPLSTDITYIGFNTENPFLKKKKIRQALSMAYNKEISLEKFYNFLAVVAHGPIPTTLEGYVAQPSTSVNFNLEKARSLLKEAGYPNGQGLPVFSLEMSSTHSVARQMAEYFQQQMSQIGVQIKLTPNTWPQFNDKIRSKKADIFDNAWNADYPDAENFLQLFYSKNISPGPNSANYKNELFDKYFEQARLLPPGPVRTRLYRNMEDLLIEDCPWIFAMHRMRTVVKQSWLKNFKFEIMILDNMKYFNIDSSLRAQESRKL